jgi:hypothetical protein
MRTVEDRSDCNRKGARAFLALPALISAVAAGMTIDFLTLAVRANRLAMPADPFKVFDSLLLGLE